jgi:hypothetical protein
VRGPASVALDRGDGVCVGSAGRAEGDAGRELDVEIFAGIDLDPELFGDEAHHVAALAAVVIEEVEVVARYLEA